MRTLDWDKYMVMVSRCDNVAAYASFTEGAAKGGSKADSSQVGMDFERDPGCTKQYG
jgi:hypothetical protein